MKSSTDTFISGGYRGGVRNFDINDTILGYINYSLSTCIIHFKILDLVW